MGAPNPQSSHAISIMVVTRDGLDEPKKSWVARKASLFIDVEGLKG